MSTLPPTPRRSIRKPGYPALLGVSLGLAACGGSPGGSAPIAQQPGAGEVPEGGPAPTKPDGTAGQTGTTVPQPPPPMGGAPPPTYHPEGT